MSHTSGPIARVRRVLAVARRLHDAHDPLGRAARLGLPISSGLTPEGVALALDECLEVDATDEELARLVAWAGTAPRTWVVAAANVCTAAVRAIALAAATSRCIAVRPSRRDPVVAEIVARALADDATFTALGGTISIERALAVAAGDEVHVYGRDETLAAVASALPPGARMRGHGTGFGVAVVESDDDVGRAAAAIARDVVRFDQRGCLSPRVVVVDRARDVRVVAGSLAAELAVWLARVPRGAPTDAERADAARFRATMEAVADVFGEEGATAFALDAGTPLVLPPAARSLVVVAADAPEVPSLFAGAAALVAAVGRDRASAPVARAMSAIAPDARTSQLGEMQRPRLDGPVDRRRPRG